MAIPILNSIGVTIIVIALMYPPHVSGQKEIRLLGLMPISGNVAPSGWSCLVPVLLAVDTVNQHPDVLPEYNLTFEYIDTENVPGRGVYKMERMLYRNPPYSMVTGPLLSVTAMATAEVSYSWNLTQLGFACSSPALSDRGRYPRFYRMGVPDWNGNEARVGVMKKFNWRKIATLHHADEFFSEVMMHFIAAAEASNITILTQQVFLHDPLPQVKNLKDEDSRIIMTAVYADKARAVLCAAYKIGLYGPKIVWFFFGHFPTKFWAEKNHEVDCTVDEMNEAMEGSFLIKPVDGNLLETKSIANLTYMEFSEKVKQHRLYRADLKKYDRVGDNCFDGIWMAALALNCTNQWLIETGHPKSLDEFTYEDIDIADVIFQCLGKTSFIGVGGRRHFPDGIDTVNTVIIERVQGFERTLIGYHWKYELPFYIQWFDENLVWAGGNIPRDSTVITRSEITIPASLYIAMCSAAGGGILLAMALLFFNIFYRNNRAVKMSSPNINNAMLIGCMMCYATIFIKNIEVTNPIPCQVRVVCFSLGFTITFGSLFSKTWRVYKIFTNKKMIRMTIKDAQLFAINGALAVVVMLIVTVWELLAPHKVSQRLLYKEIFSYGNDEEIHPYVRECYSDYSEQFGWTIYILEGALLTFGAFLAWETKKVKIEALNDSHEIGLCLYNVVILSAVGLTLSLLLEDQQVLLYGVTSGCLVIGTTLTQIIVFTNKVRAVISKVEMTVVKELTSQPTTSETASGKHTQTTHLPS